MIITYLGHSCFTIEVDNKVLLFDPFISSNELASSIDMKKLMPNYILISHGHDDHISDAVSIAKQSGATIISNYEIVNWLKNQGVENSHPMNIGGHWIFDFGKVKCVNAVHSSSLPDGSYAGNPMGFLIEASAGSFHYSGDTALTYDMKLIGDYKRMNYALLPIGNNFTMGIDNALIAAEFIRCDKIIGLHYDTFGYIKIDHEESVEKFTRNGKKLLLPNIGETFSL